jgi:hypothetical protein
MMFTEVHQLNRSAANLEVNFAIASDCVHRRPWTMPCLLWQVEDRRLSNRIDRHFLSIDYWRLWTINVAIVRVLFIVFRLPCGSRSMLHDMYMYE